MYGRISFLGNGFARMDATQTYGFSEQSRFGSFSWLFELVAEFPQDEQLLSQAVFGKIVSFPYEPIPGFPLFAGLTGNSLADIEERCSALGPVYSCFLDAAKGYTSPNKFAGTEKWKNGSNLPLLMGIVNVTPDSFSDGGKFFSRNDAVSHALALAGHGADIIDIGGESTRPGATPVSENEEMERVAPIVREIHSVAPDIVLSVDTTKAAVAERAISNGAGIINDISAGRFDVRMMSVAAESQAGLVVMHMQSTPQTMQIAPRYTSFFREVYHFLRIHSERAKSAGIKNLLIDPGIGFGKTVEQNFELIQRLREFRCLEIPLLLGLSRKSFIGKVTGLEPEQRDGVTASLEFQGMINGADCIRTHNIINAFHGREIFQRMCA